MQHRRRAMIVPGNRRRLPGEQVGLFLRDRKHGTARGSAGRIDHLEPRLVRRRFREQPDEGAPARGCVCIGRFVIRQHPAHLAQSHRLPDQPGARPAPWIFVAPMFRLGDGLPVEFEGEFGMTRREQIRIQILMTGDAGIRPNVKIAQIAHSGADAGGVSPILAGVPAQPWLAAP